MRSVTNIGDLVLGLIADRSGKPVACRECRECILLLNGMSKQQVSYNLRRVASRIANHGLSRGQCWVKRVNTATGKPLIDTLQNWILEAVQNSVEDHDALTIGLRFGEQYAIDPSPTNTTEQRVPYEWFDRVACISLDRRPDRWESFAQSIDRSDWPFRMPERFSAIDGAECDVPPGWQAGPGAWGCRESHLALMRDTIESGVSSILILEDDAEPVQDFRKAIVDFQQALPDNWQCLFLGGEHSTRPEKVTETAWRCTATTRTHCFGLREPFLSSFYTFLSDPETLRQNKSGHIDHAIRDFMQHGRHAIYCPNPWLIAQAAGHSDIFNRTFQRRMFPSVCVSRDLVANRVNLWSDEPTGDRPRVGFLSTAFMALGGTETFHRMLIPRLKETANVIGFVTTGQGGGDGGTLQVRYATGIEAARNLAAASDVLVTWGIDDIKSMMPFDRPKIIAAHHGDLSSDWSNKTILRQLDVIDSIVCVNPDVAKHFNRHGKPVRYIANAVDPERIRPSGNQHDLRSRHAIPDASRIVLFGHRMSAEKRPELAVKVAKHLPLGWTMVIAGDGPNRKRIEALANYSDRVRFVGHCDSLADWLSISSCFLSLSTSEGFGLSIAESMLSGVPTVSTPTGIATGLAMTLPTESPAEAWADAIVNAQQVASPAKIAELFNVDNMVSQWADVLKR